MLRRVRLVFFVPAAFVASVAAGAAGHWIGSFGIGIFGGGEYLAWFLSGLGSAGAFIFVGMITAPESTETVKRILLVLLAIIGLIAFVGPIMSGTNPIGGIAGAVMILVALSLTKTPAKTFDL